MNHRMHLLLALALSSTVGCGNASVAQLAKRASFDLRCDRKDLRYVMIDDQTMGVTGCGRQATYVEACRTAPVRSCTWLMNNDNQPN